MASKDPRLQLCVRNRTRRGQVVGEEKAVEASQVDVLGAVSCGCGLWLWTWALEGARRRMCAGVDAAACVVDCERDSKGRVVLSIDGAGNAGTAFVLRQP